MKDTIETILTQDSSKINKLIVYTAIFGDYDFLKEPLIEDFKDKDISFICFTDKEKESKNWKQIIIPAWKDKRLQARFFKMHPHLFFDEGQMTLWLDGVYELKYAPIDRFTCFLQNYDVVAFMHPFRNDIFEEAKAIYNVHGISEEILLAQYNAYIKEGFNEQLVLTSTGFLLRKISPKLANFGEIWFNELIKWNCLRDQMSIDYLAWKLNIAIGYVYGHYRKNGYVDLYPHGSKILPPKMKISKGQKSWIEYLW